MKAWVATARGEPDEVLQLQDYPDPPAPRADQLVIRVKAAALNPVGYKAISRFPSLVLRRPFVPEFDVAGTVVQVGGGGGSSGGDGGGDGSSGADLQVGDPVFGFIPAPRVFRGRSGALAELALVDKQLARRIPQGWDFAQAATLPLVSFTALQAFKRGHIQPGDSVFINGGSGGVGAYAVQYARAAVGPEGRVVASCSSANAELVRSLGASDVVDYRAVDPAGYLAENYADKRFTFILDTVGNGNTLYTRSPAYLVPDGVFVNVGMDPHGFRETFAAAAAMTQNLFWPAVFGGVPRKYVFMLVSDSDPGVLDKVVELVESGQVKPVIDSTYPMSDVLKAYERIMSRRARGKVVVQVS